jgi:hypothetical protein
LVPRRRQRLQKLQGSAGSRRSSCQYRPGPAHYVPERMGA